MNNKPDNTSETHLQDEPLAIPEGVINPESSSEYLAEEPSVEMLLEQLQLANAQKDANWDKYVRAEAEMDNLRHRFEKQITDAHKFAVDKFVRELLPLVDSMELGIQAALKSQNVSDELTQFIEGSEMLHKMFLATLEKFGVKSLHPLGEKLNPEHHQAVTMQPSEDYQPGTVMQVVQNGYLLNERLIRPAMVVVAQ